ncbi:class I SAM-dependent methyltransferase [Microbacterium sediminis]|uniref:SAM-dependent methyltransferase n=1 Tax=Microbacterium sediminis TaxID=904291 RepID=A0A1B9NI11_9MICO|nr:SAM-dependent methyltransferase [Microbacterium sediminis]OCG76215.1 SAM-dependent methyltransferase [Microbacterium sediminis]QBR73421.1 SAM-dependent methyltransferase [Microbacterium sediminis]
MDRPELDALLTREGLALLDTLDPVQTAADVARVVSRLRAAGHSPELVSAVVGQARLRRRAVAKFGELAGRMLFTRAGLEQATRLPVATHHAERMRAAGVGRVADLGCGIGGDALAFAALGIDVTAVDADDVTAALAAYNLAPFRPGTTVAQGLAQDADLSGVDAVWLDPARRTAGHAETRRVTAADYSPPLDWAFGLGERLPTGIKLGPAHDRDALPAHAEAQWVSDGGSTVELVLWSGALARDGVRRAALVLRDGAAHELTAPADTEDEPDRPLGAFLHEPDGAVIRARLVGDVARALRAGPVAPGIAYLTGDAAITSPFVQSFRVREILPADPKGLAKALRTRGIGTLEIKKRGVDVDPAALRTRLGLRGDASATLLLTRVGGKRIAVLADRV